MSRIQMDLKMDGFDAEDLMLKAVNLCSQQITTSIVFLSFLIAHLVWLCYEYSAKDFMHERSSRITKFCTPPSSLYRSMYIK